MNSFPSTAQPQAVHSRFGNFAHEPVRLSINQVTTYDWSLEEAVEKYARAGIDAIGLWLPRVVDFGEGRVEDLLHESRLSVSSLSWAGGFTGANGYDLEHVLDETRELIRLAGRLQSQTLVVVSGPRKNHIQKHATRLVIQALAELAEDAADHDVVLALQPMRTSFADDWTFLHSLDQSLSVLQQVREALVKSHQAFACDYVKLAFDTYQLGREPDLLNRLTDIVSDVGIVQVSDGKVSPDSEYERVFPGEGELPVNAIVSGLVDAGYRGFLDYQIWSEDLWQAHDEGALRRCRDNFQRFCPVAP